MGSSPLCEYFNHFKHSHVSQERWTRKNLDFVKIHYPGAFHPQVRYVCAAGKAVFGKRGLGTWLAYQSYELTVGKGETWGDEDKIVEAAVLDEAQNLVLEGVWHSPRSPGKWYGSPEVFHGLDWVFVLETNRFEVVC